MNSLILQIAVRYLVPVMFLVSVLLLFRGHHQPGGGFIGALLASSALIFKIFVTGSEEAKRNLLVRPLMLIIAGLSVAFSASIIPLFLGMSFFQGAWSDISLPLIGKLGTPLLFDTGIYLLVLGIVSKIVLSIGD